MSNETPKTSVKLGDYVVIQKQDYTKLHKVTLSSVVMLGKDQLELDDIIGKPIWTTYKMEPKMTVKRVYVLRECNNSESLAEQLKKDVSSGSDNRNICDDGRSQLLSTEEIVGLRTSGMSGQDIVGQLIENSKTFRDKTEYSQEKYLKKKEKKYFEYVTIRWPTIRLISEIMYRMDPVKIMGLRIDTLSQILTNVGLHSHGTYMLYESGCQGLVAAAMLNNIIGDGRLLLIHPGNLPQTQAVLAMNYDSNQMACLVNVNINSLLLKLRDESSPQEESKVDESESSASKPETDVEVLKNEKNSLSEDGETKEAVILEPASGNNGSVCDSSKEEGGIADEGENKLNVVNEKKRKHSDTEENVAKKPRRELEIEKAADLLRPGKADGLVLVAREHPTSILTALLPYVAPSRPFVVYSQYREPLLDLYLHLKGKNNTVALRLTETWLRSHQILPNRTHPDILMSGGGGYLLTGIVVDPGSIAKRSASSRR